MEFHSCSEPETIAFAARIAKTLKSGDVVLLSGDLGAGKSVFARAVIRVLSGNPALDVPSPTYTLVQVYETPVGPVWHFDLYRLKSPDEVFELGWDDALADGIVLVEWPERLGGTIRLPKSCFYIQIAGDGLGSRRITVSEAR